MPAFAVLAAFALAAGPAPARAASPASPVTPFGPTAHVDAVERLPLPRAAGPVTVRVEPFEARVAVDAPRDPAALRRTLRSISRLLCPMVEEAPQGAILHCRSTRIEAAVVAPGGAPALQIRELTGLPGAGEGAMPIVFHDPASLGLGSCTQARSAAHGECLLRAGKTQAAADAFRLAVLEGGAGLDLARLRLGDLAHAAGNTTAAVAAWSEVREQPWLRLALARRCELSRSCLVDKATAVYDPGGLPPSMAGELRLRSARARAFAGDPVGAASALAGEWSAGGVCSGERPLCRRIVLAALRSPGARADEALALHVAAVRSDGGPYALELARAAARLAEEAGAPGFAAALLASGAGRVDQADVPDHLLKTAELYVAAGDQVRAGVVADFARSRLGAKVLASRRWKAVLHVLSAPPPAAPVVPRGAGDPTPDLSLARAVVARAQSLSGAAP